MPKDVVCTTKRRLSQMVIKDRSDRCKKLVKCSCQLRHAKTININNHSKMLINRSCYNSPSKSPSKKNMKKLNCSKSCWRWVSGCGSRSFISSSLKKPVDRAFGPGCETRGKNSKNRVSIDMIRLIND